MGLHAVILELNAHAITKRQDKSCRILWVHRARQTQKAALETHLFNLVDGVARPHDERQWLLAAGRKRNDHREAHVKRSINLASVPHPRVPQGGVQFTAATIHRTFKREGAVSLLPSEFEQLPDGCRVG